MFMEGQPSSPGFQLPPGFRFHPSDEELIVHYLQNKVTSRPLPASVIAEIDLYKHNPWELPNKALFGEDEWFFFSPRDRKYPNGARPNRTAGSGYWKATGTDKPIFSSYGSKSLGVKKALVFYTGRPPKGIKTDWTMTEYRLLDSMIKPSRLKGSMRLDDWVLCRVRLKGSMLKSASEVHGNQKAELMVRHSPKIDEGSHTYTDYNTDIITDCLYKDSVILANQPLLSIHTISSSNNGQSITSVYEGGGHSDNIGKSPSTASSLETCLGPQKRKPSAQENRYENILLSNRKPNSDDMDHEEFPHNKTLCNSDLNYYMQCHEGIYPNMSDPINYFQELNEFTFTGKYLQ